jgi:hypothetical protein
MRLVAVLLFCSFGVAACGSASPPSNTVTPTHPGCGELGDQCGKDSGCCSGHCSKTKWQCNQ